jgi:hypothetical protein
MKYKTTNGRKRIIGHKRGRCVAMVALVGLLLGLLGQPAAGQLAITEAMSSASTNGLADFWELTNFGTNNISLTGYRWNDNNGGRLEDYVPLDGLTISNLETIIFVIQANSVITNAQMFRDWWGPSLPATTRIFFYSGMGNGLGPSGDSIRLWGPDATNDNDTADSVDFGIARRGSTFTYDPATGLFGFYSVTNVPGVFRSALHNDIGSPGVTAGSIPIRILAQPVSVAICAGTDTGFSVKAAGLPRPHYQWFFNGLPVAGGTSPTLLVLNPQPTNAGNYQVEISSDTNLLLSTTVTLTVDAEPKPPTVFTPFTDVQVLSNETARFFAPVCALPMPTFQWCSNGVTVAGATNRTLVIKNCQPAMSGTLFCVNITNSLGGTSICARLTVLPKPNLVITEVMPSPSDCVLSTDWFEITNFGSNAVSLLGYRFATGNGSSPSLEGARVITNNTLLQPGESAVFVRGFDLQKFIEWWGDALPPSLVLISYSGIGLGAASDQLHFWGPGTEDPLDVITEVIWAGTSPGVSKYYLDNVGGGFDDPSLPGEGGAFVAAQCSDVGSPGYTNNPPPRFVRILRDGAGATLRWRSISNATYHLKWKSELSAATWTPLVTRTATSWVEMYVDATATNSVQRFYFLEKLP